LLSFFDTKVRSFFQSTLFEALPEDEIDKFEELDTMFESLDTYTHIVQSYCSHRLRAKVQFNAIQAIKNKWLTADTSRMLIVMDHKQKVLPMKYRKGQVEYFGKKGMSLLGLMLVQAIPPADDADLADAPQFSYFFINCVVKGYAGQDHIQVAGVLQCLVRYLQRVHPNTRQVAIQSDNASCFSSQELIPFIYHMNGAGVEPFITWWIFTKPQTGKGRLDTHFSYVNVMLKLYVEDGYNIVLEDDIVKALLHRGGISNTTCLLLDASNLAGPVTSKKFTAKTGARSTHDIIF